MPFYAIQWALVVCNTISCITVISQVVRHLPGVRVEVSYDNMWRTRFPEGRQVAKPDAWKIFDVLEGSVEAE